MILEQVGLLLSQLKWMNRCYRQLSVTSRCFTNRDHSSSCPTTCASEILSRKTNNCQFLFETHKCHEITESFNNVEMSQKITSLFHKQFLVGIKSNQTACIRLKVTSDTAVSSGTNQPMWSKNLRKLVIGGRMPDLRLLHYPNMELRRNYSTTHDKHLPIIYLFTKEECSLCDVAKAALKPYRHRFILEEVDITLPENADWFEKYKYDIPVFHMHEDFLFMHKVDLDLLERALQEHEEKHNKTGP